MPRKNWAKFLVNKRLQLLGCETQRCKERWQQKNWLLQYLPWESQISANSCDWGIGWSLHRETLAESKICPLYRYQQCPKTWTNNSNCLTWWLLTLWIVQTNSHARLSYVTVWTNERYQMLKSDHLQEKYRNRNSNNFFMWTLNLLSLLDVMNSVYDKVVANLSICSFLQKVISTIYSSSILFWFESGWVGTLEIIETSFSS